MEPNSNPNPNSGSKAISWIIGIVVVIIILFLGAHFLGKSKAPIVPSSTPSPTVQGTEAVQTNYLCDGGNSIGATFTGNEVNLTLSSGENLTLIQTNATSGAVFENPDGTTVLTVLGPNATLTENGAQVFQNCIEPKG